MRKKPFTVLSPTGGLNLEYDPVFIADRESANLSNVRFHKGVLKKDLGWSPYASNFGGPILMIDNFPRRTGDIHLLVATDTKIYKREANGTWTLKYSGAHADLDNCWSSAITYDANGNDLYVVTNGVDPVLKWDGSGANFANLGGLTNIYAKYVFTFMNRLLLGHTTESGSVCPFRVRWSVAGNPEDWANEGSGFVDIADTPDFVTGFSTIRNRLFVFKERSIWELMYVGGTIVFLPVKRVDAIGTTVPRGYTELGDSILFYGTDNVYIYDGFNLEQIGDPIYPLLYEADTRIVNAAKLHRSCSVYVEELGQFWLCVPTVGDLPDTVFKFDMQAKAWTVRPEEVTAYGFTSVDTGVSWWDTPGTWAEQTDVWLHVRLRSEAPLTLKGTYEGDVYVDDRLHEDTNYCEFQTKDFVFGHGHRLVEARVRYKGGPLDVFYSTDGGGTWTYMTTLSETPDWTEGIAYCNLTARKVRFKLSSLTATNLEVKWVEPWIIERKRAVA